MIGAHTYGFNTLSSGIAVLGDFRTAAVPEAVRSTVARVAAAKLGQYGLSPAGTAQLTEGVSDGKFRSARWSPSSASPGIATGSTRSARATCSTARCRPSGPRRPATSFDLVAKPITGGAASGGYYYVKDRATLNS